MQHMQVQVFSESPSLKIFFVIFVIFGAFMMVWEPREPREPRMRWI